MRLTGRENSLTNKHDFLLSVHYQITIIYCTNIRPILDLSVCQRTNARPTVCSTTSQVRHNGGVAGGAIAEPRDAPDVEHSVH